MIGPHANFIPSKDECRMEDIGILPSYPSLRPGDVLLHSSSNPLQNQLNFKSPITAIDITTIGHQPPCMESPSTLKETNDNSLKHHLDQESKKYNRPAQKIRNRPMVSGEAIIHELNEQNITLLPFTFDDFGSMGPLATSYFFDNKNTPSITDKKILSKFPAPALKAYKKGCSHLQTKMNTLFKAANKGWKLLNKDKWYGSTYQLTSPSNWGQQYLAMNLNISIINHLKKHSPSLTNLLMSKPKAKNVQY